ncbi:MAG: SPFH domain-containing protein [Acidobacteriota bacterium]
MSLLVNLLVYGGFVLIATAIGLVAWDVYWKFMSGFVARLKHAEVVAGEATPARCIRWKSPAVLVALACLCFLAASSIVVVPSGMAGVRVSEVSGTLPGTLHPGTHLVWPLVHRVELFNIRDQVYSTGGPGQKLPDALQVQTREGLAVGLGITVRYRLDPGRLDYVHASLPQPVEQEIVLPVVTTAFREVVPNYLVRDVFAVKREEVRKTAASMIVKKLAADGIVVKEVMLRDIVLPHQYAQGMEALLVMEQENDRIGLEIEVKQKQVRTAELEAEAAKAREVKKAEAAAQVAVLQAKSQSDAMQYTLPLKEKQIQQTRLEAEAKKESTIKNAEAAAQAKLIDSKAEAEKAKIMAEVEGVRIRTIAAADAERMRSEAEVLKQNPLLIQKIIAERLSDKVQIMMVPSDGKFFFANDVLRATPLGFGSSSDDDNRRR